MKGWWLALGVGIGLAVLMGIPYLLATLARRYGGDDLGELPKPRPLYHGFDPSLRERRAFQRDIAEKSKRRGQRIDSGGTAPSALLRQVK